MNKEINGKEMFNQLKHLVINDVCFSIVQIKTRRTQKISVIRWLTEDQKDILREALESDEGIIVGKYANVRDALRAIKSESKCNARLDMYIRLKDDVIAMKKSK